MTHLLSILALSGCNVSDQAPAGEQEAVDPVGRIGGYVTDSQGNALDGVKVFADGMETTTDADGHYLLEGVEPSDQILVTFRKEGYAKSYTNTSLVSWEIATANKSLLEIDGYDFFDAVDGGVVQVDKVTVEFDADSIVGPDGQPFDGEVRAEITHLDPWDPAEMKSGPGDLRALERVDSDGKEEFTSTQLVSYGMADVTLYDEDGNELNLEEGQSARVEMPISNGELGEAVDWYTLAAGDQQKTWSFDTSSGAWIEEGIGVVGADEDGELTFSFEATHFSWWNCDDGYIPTCATGRVIDELGFPVRSAELQAIGAVSNSVVTTDEDGYYTANVFAGDTVTFTGSTLIPGDVRSWQADEVEFIDGSTSDPSVCQPIEDIQIEVCREVGVVMTDNLEVHLSETEDGGNADRLNALFWDPPGDPELCVDPWSTLDMEECRVYDPDDFPSYGEFDEDGLPTDLRDVGDWLTIETDRDTYTMEIEEDEPGQVVYTYSVHSLDKDAVTYVETNDIDFQGGDVLGASSEGNSSMFLGPISEENWVTLPADLEIDLSGPQVAPTNGGMSVSFTGAGDADGILMMGSGSGPDAGSVVCRFQDDGSLTIPSDMLDEMGAGAAGVSLYRPSLGWTPGPDGYPVRVQAFSGAVIEVDIK